VTITTATSFFVLKFDRSAYDAAVESGVEITDEGVEEAFEVVCEIPEACVPLFLCCYRCGG
jgi:coatomer subunit beta'